MEILQSLGFVKWLENKIAAGQIGYTGFSFHDSFEAFQNNHSYDNWTLAQIHTTIWDENIQAGTRGLEYAHKKVWRSS